MLNKNIMVPRCIANKSEHILFILFLVIAGRFLMVIGGDRPFATEERWINDIEVVSFDPANSSVPECLQNLNPFPAYSISGCVVRF